MVRILSRQREKRSRRLGAGALGGISALTLAAGLAWTAAPAAQAGTTFYEVAFQTNTGNLATVGVQNDGTLSGLNGLMPGTNPSITFNEGNNLGPFPSGYEEAYQDTIGQLDTFGPDGFQIWATDMARGTSPSISAFGEAGIELAYHNSAGDIITEGGGAGGLKDWGPAWPGTSPSVTTIGLGETYEVTFQNASGNLVTAGPDDNHGAWSLGMMAGTSPSITQLSNGGYQVAFQANTGSLWTVHSGASGGTNLKQGMMAGTSPAITLQPNGGYEIAFQANTGSLITVGTTNNVNWKLGMKAGTSPAIIVGPSGSQYEVAFQANTGQVWTVGEDDHDAWNSDNTTAVGTSPSIAN